MPASKKDESAAKGDVQEQIDEETAQGYRGVKVDPLPDSAYTLESGPDSPPYLEDDKTRAAVPTPKEEK